MFPKKTKLFGWSEYKKYDCEVFFPQNKYEICEFIKNNKNIKIIPRGHGCSFGDQAICSADLGAVIDMSKMNKIISFDEKQNILSVDAGIQLKDILKFSIPKNLILASIPGGLEITVGGAIANNVHGKDCFKKGYFESNVLSMEVINSEGNLIKLSETENPEIFKNVFYSMGLLCIIVKVEIKLIKIPSQILNVETKIINNSNDMKKSFEDLNSDNADYCVAWLDCFARDKNLLRGLFQTAKFVKDDKKHIKLKNSYFESPDKKKVFGFIPIGFFWFIAKIFFRTSIFRYLNSIIFNLSKNLSKKKFVPFVEFMMLETKYLPSYKSWFKPYGFLTIHPFFFGSDAFEKIKEAIILCQKHGVIPFWCPIKKYKKNNNHPLAFGGEGYSIVIDFFPKEYEEGKLKIFFNDFEALILKQGGKYYLSKDQIMSKEFFKRTYPKLDEFKKIKSSIDKNDIFISNQFRRLFK